MNVRKLLVREKEFKAEMNTDDMEAFSERERVLGRDEHR